MTLVHTAAYLMPPGPLIRAWPDIVQLNVQHKLKLPCLSATPHHVSHGNQLHLWSASRMLLASLMPVFTNSSWLSQLKAHTHTQKMSLTKYMFQAATTMPSQKQPIMVKQQQFIWSPGFCNNSNLVTIERFV